MVYITGDTHGKHDFDKIKKFVKANPKLTREDYILIAGDFGGVWNEATLEKDLKPYKELPVTVLFIDGNHENFELLNDYEVDYFSGGKVHMIADNIIHLMRGQVFKIEGQTYFTFGGSESIDRAYRTEGISWWPQEVPSNDEYKEAVENLKRHNMEVDFIVTHAIDEETLNSEPFCKFNYIPFLTNHKLNFFEEKVKYGHWYFAHYHNDMEVNPKKTAMFNKIQLVPTLAKTQTPAV